MYPIKLGICFILSIAFLLSYVFKRFEKRIFVFGIISVIALLMGSYYDEHRFSKYIMMGLVGFAALLIFDVMTAISGREMRFRQIYLSILIGVVIMSASLSVLLFAAYAASAIENRYTPYLVVLPKRLFLNSSEMDAFRFIYSDSDNERPYYNIATSPEGYDFHRGFIGKIQAFTGVPREKLYEGRSILESSSIQILYDKLEKTNTRYIVIPKLNNTDGEVNSINGNTGRMESMKDPGRFVLQSFPTAFENDNILVLSVPPLSGTSPPADNVLVYPDAEQKSDACMECYLKQVSYDHYYPFSMLALSGIRYDAVREEDMSGYTPNNSIILTRDPPVMEEDKNQINSYLRFAEGGGTVIVTNTDPNYTGTFSKLFSIDPIKKVRFDSIDSLGKHSLNISGIATDVRSNLSEVKTRSFYLHNGVPVAPFAMEKAYGNNSKSSDENAGKIFYVNIAGYYDTITKHPNKYFQTLSAIMKLINGDDYLRTNSVSPDQQLNSQAESNSRVEEEEIPLQEMIRLPGDITEEAKREGVVVPWQYIMASPNNIALLLSIISITVIGGLIVNKKLSWRQKVQKNEQKWW